MGARAGEVLIVGGGLIGSSIAWRLAQRGIRVRIADAGGFAQSQSFSNGEASTAGAGMLSPGGEFSSPSPWVDLGVRSLRLYPDFVDELRAETGIDVDFRMCGCLDVTAVPDAARIEFQRSAGIQVDVLPNGLLYPDDALVDPAALLISLRRALMSRGVEIDTQRICKLEAEEHRAVVIASGSWSSAIGVTAHGISIDLPASIPIKGHLIGYQMQPGLLGAYLRSGHTYVLQRSDGFVIAGSTEEQVGFDIHIDPAICEDLHRRAGELVPELRSTQPSKRWIGFRPGPDLPTGPHMRRLVDAEGNPTNAWLAYGHYRNGILLTPLTAERISNEIATALPNV